MRIGIDARFLTHPQQGGFKTYTVNLINAIHRLDYENQYFIYLDRPPHCGELPTKSNFYYRVLRGTLPIVGLPWREQVALGRQARVDGIDLFHSPCLTAPLSLSCPLVITVHDMIWAFPENFTSRGSWSLKRRFIDWYNYLVPMLAIPRASAVITVSQASKDSILNLLQLDSRKIVITHEAAGSAFRQIADANQLEAMQKKYELPPKYILALGAADPRKNIKTLIQAYGSISDELRTEYKLVIVWTHPFLASDISKLVDELGLTEDIRFLQQVSDEDLVLIYNLASLFVFPSRNEGFGLPILEAMSCGVPVIAANNSSIPEIAGDAAEYFDAMKPQSMIEVIIRVLEDEAFRSNLACKGPVHARAFSWDSCAEQTIDVYNRIVAMKFGMDES